jgi:hypothetical protein
MRPEKLTTGKLGFNGGWEADATASAQRNARPPLNTNEHISHITEDVISDSQSQLLLFPSRYK